MPDEDHRRSQKELRARKGRMVFFHHGSRRLQSYPATQAHACGMTPSSQSVNDDLTKPNVSDRSIGTLIALQPGGWVPRPAVTPQRRSRRLQTLETRVTDCERNSRWVSIAARDPICHAERIGGLAVLRAPCHCATVAWVPIAGAELCSVGCVRIGLCS
jgi:hypothetical protein